MTEIERLRQENERLNADYKAALEDVVRLSKVVVTLENQLAETRKELLSVARVLSEHLR